MQRLIWSEPALRDVQRLYRFLAGKNPHAATRAVKAIRAGVRNPRPPPGDPRPAEDMEPEYREWIIDFGDSGYIALYHYDGETALILDVRHQTGGGVFLTVPAVPHFRRVGRHLFACPPISCQISRNRLFLRAMAKKFSTGRMRF